MDTLTLKGLQYDAGHGYYQKEREQGNRFEVDLIFRLDLQKAGRDDDLNQTVDYQQAERIVSSVMHGTSKKLIESLVYEIGNKLFEEFDILQQLKVKVRKINPPLPATTDHSEVAMTWNR